MKTKTTKTGVKSTILTSTPGVVRPPVVVVLGHIDHGKTTLLSKIKEMDLTRKEHGGITQHIGAYRVRVKEQESKRAREITFIDTPGHKAFNEMRSRGAKVADLAILVVAANEGVKPQTLESLKYIQEAGINYLVALNKIDLPEVNLEQAKKNLLENGIMIEGYGGEVVVVPVSAKTGKGIEELLEMILLLAEMMGIKGDPEGELQAIVVEAKLDSRRGPVATILVRDGSLKVGDEIKIESTFGKIRAMFNEKGENVTQALPGEPVEVLGLKTVPPVGGKVERVAKKTYLEELKLGTEPQLQKTVEEAGKAEEQKLKIILKADTIGTLEAIKTNLPGECQIIKAEVGEVNESDILLAAATKAEIIAFNVKIPSPVKKLAEAEKVKIAVFRVIYELLEDVDKRILKILEPTIGEEILGKAEILAEFKMDQKVAGCRVIEGEIRKTEPLHLLRNNSLIGDVRIKSLRKGKQDVDQVKKGEEFGVVFSPHLDFKIGDMLVSYRKPPA